MANPYAPPTAPVSDPQSLEQDFEYAGFWVRFGAMFIDSIIWLIVIVPLLYWFYGAAYFDGMNPAFLNGTADSVIWYLLPAVLTVAFWSTKGATPGKMALSIRIVDANTGGKVSLGRSIGRYLAYIPSAIVLYIGFLWVAFDGRKQGWHDKLAGTLVIRDRK
jgi:uncharacterized RDD family membrane protein YckC